MKNLAAAVIGGLVMGLGAAQAQPVPTEYQVKAAFLFNFVSFVEWPQSALPEDEVFRFCIVGEDPFDGALERILQGETIGGRKPVVRGLEFAPTASECQVIFVSTTVSSLGVQRLLETTGEIPVLTVGDDRAFVAEGGIIGFHVDGSRVRFDVNHDAAKRSGLRVSSHLLKLATNVAGSAAND